jgi:hypothetical protein
MAIKDPLVSLFAVMTTSQLLGLSFVQYFPTWVSSFDCTSTMIIQFGLGLLKHLDLILPTLYCSLRRLTIPSSHHKISLDSTQCTGFLGS